MSTILLVDDTPEDRRPLAKLLRTRGYNVITAINAFEAMAAVSAKIPDLILLEFMIPPMDGLTFLMLLRDSAVGRNTPSLSSPAWTIPIPSAAPESARQGAADQKPVRSRRTARVDRQTHPPQDAPRSAPAIPALAG